MRRRRSGKFRAKNDFLIEELVKDERYQVRSDGTIWFLAHDSWRQTGKAVSRKGEKDYYTLKYKGQLLVVHRVVYRAHIGKLAEDMVVNHIDGNSLNNCATNLELCTQQQNVQHAYDTTV